AVVLAGALRRGASGGTGEIGFLPVPGTGRLPSATDCAGGFHSLAGASAVADLARAHAVTPRPGVEPEAAGAVQAAVRALEEADTAPAPGAHRFLDALADRGVVGVASAVAVLDPGGVGLGGEVGQAGGEPLAVRGRAGVARMSPLPAGVRPGEPGGSAGLKGGRLTARGHAQDALFGSSRG